MRVIYHLSSCSTCQKIIGQLKLPEDVQLIDIKQTNIDATTLDWLREKVGSYDALFSKRAMKFRGMGLHELQLSDTDLRQYMLDEYTFLKRPFIIYDEHVFIGNAAKTVAEAVAFFEEL